MPKGDIVEYIVVIDVKGIQNDKGITSGYGGRMKIAGIQNNKGITMLQVAGCNMNDKR